jgi:hypothetical protein
VLSTATFRLAKSTKAVPRLCGQADLCPFIA